MGKQEVQSNEMNSAAKESPVTKIVIASDHAVTNGHGSSSEFELDSLDDGESELPVSHVHVEFSPKRRLDVNNRRSMKWQELAGRSGRRGSSNMSSLVSSITFSDFDDDSFFNSYSSRRWNLDECLETPLEEEEPFNDCNGINKAPCSNDVPICPTRRDSLSSGKISSSLRRLRDLSGVPVKSNSSERPPNMPWRKQSVKRLDCNPVKPGRQESISTLVAKEEGTVAPSDDGSSVHTPCLVRSSGKRALF